MISARASAQVNTGSLRACGYYLTQGEIGERLAGIAPKMKTMRPGRTCNSMLKGIVVTNAGLFKNQCHKMLSQNAIAPNLFRMPPYRRYLKELVLNWCTIRKSVEFLALALRRNNRSSTHVSCTFAAKRAASCILAIRCVLLAALFSVLSGVAIAQVDQGSQEIDDPSDAQNWSHNWSESWKDRRSKWGSKKHSLTHWQLSEHTLLTLYGQLNIGQLDYYDGFDHHTKARDNPNSPSRVGLILETDFDNGKSLFMNIETAVPKSVFSRFIDNPIDAGNDNQWDKSLLRKAEARLTVPHLGYFSFGQGSMASDGITGFDFSKTTLVASNSVGDTASGFPARFASGAVASADISSFYPNYDGTRRFRLRYDGLSKNGLSLAASAGREVLTSGNDNTYADIAIRYETSWRGFGVKGGIGYSYNGEFPEFVSGSVAGLDSDTGLNFAIAFGASTSGGEYVYGKLGLIRNIIKPGWTAISIDYYRSNDPLNVADKSTSMGFAIVQKIDAYDLELYATYRTYKISGSIARYADSNAVFAGLRFSW